MDEEYDFNKFDYKFGFDTDLKYKYGEILNILFRILPQSNYNFITKYISDNIFIDKEYQRRYVIKTIKQRRFNTNQEKFNLIEKCFSNGIFLDIILDPMYFNMDNINEYLNIDYFKYFLINNFFKLKTLPHYKENNITYIDENLNQKQSTPIIKELQDYLCMISNIRMILSRKKIDTVSFDIIKSFIFYDYKTIFEIKKLIIK